MFDDQMRNRFIGSLLGLAVGDATGAPFEGLTASHIYQTGPARKLLENPREYFFVKDESSPTLRYTDDTQMMIGITETLIECHEIQSDYLLQRFLFHYDPNRGYGKGIRRLFTKLRREISLDEAIRSIFPDGSFGNGAAMRVAPVGLFFAFDLDRVEAEAEVSAKVTHIHPLGVEGAKLLALAVALAATTPTGTLRRDDFLRQLQQRTQTEEFQWQLETLRNINRDVPISFGNGAEAHRSVVSAVQLFVDYPDSFFSVLQHSIGLGGDTDTIAAMACSLSGAYLGKDAIPPHLLDFLENDQPFGREGIEFLAIRLFQEAKLSLF
ncbi:MAG: ADP-ribosylglycohydrolase family protein [Planctomycetia bacterium]|nr:ADP-ribosylglycohydrolase family protein [Planctomycetia bacterium]